MMQAARPIASGADVLALGPQGVLRHRVGSIAGFAGELASPPLQFFYCIEDCRDYRGGASTDPH